MGVGPVHGRGIHDTTVKQCNGTSMSDILHREYPHVQFRKHWSLSDRALMLLGQCEAYVEGMYNTPILPPQYAELMQVALLTGAQDTTAIEGNTLLDEDIRLIMADEKLPPSKEYQEIEGVKVRIEIMKTVLTVIAMLASCFLFPINALAEATVVREEQGDCGKPKPGGERFKNKYYIDSNGDGKVDHVRVLFCDGNATMTKPVIIGSNNLDAHHYFLLEDYGNTHLGDVLVWFEGPVRNDAGQVVGSVVKDSTSIQSTVTFFSHVRMTDEDLEVRRVHPEQNYTSFEAGSMLFRPTQKGLNRIEISRWSGTVMENHAVYVYVDHPPTEHDAYRVNIDQLNLASGSYFLTVSNAGSVLLQGRFELK